MVGSGGAGQEHAEVMRFKAITEERKRGVLPLSYPSRHEKRRREKRRRRNVLPPHAHVQHEAGKRRDGQKGRLHEMDSFPGIVCLFWHLVAQNVEKKL